ncbi:MAG: ParA family protein [Polyangiaceae bacterium]
MVAVSLLSQKGGVGKTTLALNLALSFARRGSRTLLIDADPQGAIGLSLGGKAREAPGLYAHLAQSAAWESVLLPTREANLVLLPSGDVRVEHLDDWATRLSSEATLAEVVRSAAREFDVVLVDTPAGVTGPAAAAAAAAGNVLIPLQAEPLSLRTLPRVLECVGHWRSQGKQISVAGVVLTMSAFRNETALAVLEEAWGLYPELVLETHVPRDDAMAQASAAGVPVGLLRRRSPPVASVFDAMASELTTRLGIITEEEENAPRSLLD